ncbi:MAG: proton-conducting transporter membrane subunit [Infirmifilum sp.]
MYAGLIPFLLFATSLLILLLGRASRRLCELLAVIATGGSAALSLYLLVEPEPTATGPLAVLTDPLSRFMLAVVNGLGFLIVVYSVGYMSGEKSFVRYYFFILLFIGAMSGLVLSEDLVYLYLFWELVGVCSAMLISFWWEKPEARRAGLKAFAVTRVGDIGFLLAIALAIHSLGTTRIPYVLAGLNKDPSLASITGLLLVIAATGKSAQLPLMVWLPDAMEGPTSVSALIHAATMVKAGVYLVSRFYPALTHDTLTTLFWIALATSLISAVSALASQDLKRVLAFSTINHLALMFLALGAGAWASAQLHLLSHSLFKALLFLCAGLIAHETGTRNLDEIGGLWKGGMRLTATAFLIGALSLAGVPPFPGYFTKEAVLASFEKVLGSEGHLFAFVLSFLSTAYIFRLFLRLFLGAPKERYEERNLWMITPILVLASLTCIGFVLLEAASSILGVELPEVHVDWYAVSGLAAGLALALGVWGVGLVSGFRRALYGFARVADGMFYLDDLYTWVARKVAYNASTVTTRLQQGNPAYYTLWLFGFVILLFIIVLAVT